MQEVKVIVDNRERNSSIIEGLEDAGADVVIERLPVGDYILSDRICVERKTLSDFENSIMNARLFEQLLRLSGSFERPMLIIENNDEPRLSRNVILGAILKAYVDYNVQVIESGGPDDTVSILYGIAKREQDSKEREPRLLGAKKAYTERQWQQLILESVPGVGPKLTKSLLEHFKSIKNVANASEKELANVDKIGRKKAARIYSILNKEYDVGE